MLLPESFYKVRKDEADEKGRMKGKVTKIAKGDGFAILELRAGTHLFLEALDQIEPGDAPFDLMVEDLDTTHSRLVGLGLSPSAISEGKIHRSFTIQDPSGHVVKFNSSHVSDQPV